MTSRNIEDYDFDNPNRVTICASFGISSNNAKTISKTVNVPINQSEHLNKTIDMPFKKAKSLSVSTIISNLKKLAAAFDVNLPNNINTVSLDGISLEEVEKVVQFANSSVFDIQGANLKEAYFKFQNVDGTFTHKSYIVESVKVSDEAFLPPHKATNATLHLTKILPYLLSLLAVLSSTELRQITKDLSIGIITSFLFEYALKPFTEQHMKNESLDQEDCKNESSVSENERLSQFLANKRITTKNLTLFESVNKKSLIIEHLPEYTLLTVIPDNKIHKSWLRVKITLDQGEVEGYVLRRYTSPIK